MQQFKTLKFWHDPKARSLLYQGVALLTVLIVAAMLSNNVAANLERQGIASGFGFLSSTAGFEISMHLIPYSEEMTYGRAFFVAILNTLLVSGLGVILATIIGFVVGVARLSQNWLVSTLAAGYVEVLRNVPLLLQLFFWYFAVLRNLPSPRESMNIGDIVFLNIRGLSVPRPILYSEMAIVGLVVVASFVASAVLIAWSKRRQRRTGRRLAHWSISTALLVVSVGASLIFTGFPIGFEMPVLSGFNFDGGIVLNPEFVALLLSLSLYTAAFIAEIVRAGIVAIPRGQQEAALSLGLTRRQTLRLVIIPQAMRIIVPPLTSQYLNLTKNSSLAAAIAYPDLVLVFAGTVLMQTGQAVEVIALTMLVYLTISLTISLAMNFYNRRIALIEN